MQLKDKQLEDTASSLGDQTNRQIDWLCTRVKVISPQALTGPTDVAAEMKAAIPKKQNPSSVPEPLWAPAVAGLLTAVVGIASVIAGQPWLFPSLGPTAYLQAEMPAHPASKLYNVVVGHLVGLIAGFASVFLFNALNEPSVLQDHRLTAMRAAAAVLAIVLTMLVAHLLRANHPPAGATTLLVALGALKTLNDGVNLMIGVVIIAVVGEVLRSMRIGKVATRVPAKARVPANAGR